MPRGRASGPLTQQQLGALGEAALKSATILISDAMDLLERGSPPHAYASAILAGEEFGKCQLAVGAIARDAAAADYWKSFWRTFYGHGPKLALGAVVASRWVPQDRIEAFVEVMLGALRERRRERALYVDMVDGAVVTPGDEISAVEAAQTIDAIGGVVVPYAEVFKDGGLAQAFNDVAEDAKRMRAALDSRDIDRARQVWLETTGRTLDQVEMDLIVTGWEEDDDH